MRPLVVRITHPDYEVWTGSLQPHPTPLVSVREVLLETRVAGVPAPAHAASLSELAGEDLPPLQGQSITSHEVPTASLLPRDVLEVVSFYAGSRDVKLVSKLIEFTEGRFVVHWVRLPISSLEERPSLGDHYVVDGRGLRKIRMSPRKLQDYKRFLRARRAVAGRLPPTNRGERVGFAREIFAAYHAESQRDA